MERRIRAAQNVIAGTLVCAEQPGGIVDVLMAHVPVGADAHKAWLMAGGRVHVRSAAKGICGRLT